MFCFKQYPIPLPHEQTETQKTEKSALKGINNDLLTKRLFQLLNIQHLYLTMDDIKSPSGINTKIILDALFISDFGLPNVTLQLASLIVYFKSSKTKNDKKLA